MHLMINIGELTYIDKGHKLKITRVSIARNVSGLDISWQIFVIPIIGEYSSLLNRIWNKFMLNYLVRDTSRELLRRLLFGTALLLDRL